MTLRLTINQATLPTTACATTTLSNVVHCLDTDSDEEFCRLTSVFDFVGVLQIAATSFSERNGDSEDLPPSFPTDVVLDTELDESASLFDSSSRLLLCATMCAAVGMMRSATSHL